MKFIEKYTASRVSVVAMAASTRVTYYPLRKFLKGIFRCIKPHNVYWKFRNSFPGLRRIV